MARLLGPTLGMLASSKAWADWRSSTLRKPALAKARAAPSGRPLRSQSFDASQYSSNDEGLRLISDISPHPCRAEAACVECTTSTGPPSRFVTQAKNNSLVRKG